MNTLVLCVVATIVLAALGWLWLRYTYLKREAFIRSYEFPRGLFMKLCDAHPGLSLKDCQLVAQGLRQFFLAYLQGRRRLVSMPSQVADTLWHEFILYTRDYQRFCSTAFGQFLHHSPAVTMGSVARSNEGLRRVWWYACKQENINPRRPLRLPLLFALDAKFNIANGFTYMADCSGVRRQGDQVNDTALIYCGGDFGDLAFDGNLDGFGDHGISHGIGDFSFSGDSSGGWGGDAGAGDGGGSSGCGGGGCST